MVQFVCPVVNTNLPQQNKLNEISSKVCLVNPWRKLCPRFVVIHEVIFTAGEAKEFCLRLDIFRIKVFSKVEALSICVFVSEERLISACFGPHILFVFSECNFTHHFSSPPLSKPV